MSNKQSICIEVDDDGPDSFNYEIDLADNAQLTLSIAGEEVTLYLNKRGCMKLAELLVKLGKGQYKSGFHVHLGRNFDPDSEHVLCLMLDQE